MRPIYLLWNKNSLLVMGIIISAGMLLFALVQNFVPIAKGIFGVLGDTAVLSYTRATEKSSEVALQTVAPVAKPIQEVHIANNGLVLLRGAHVESISGSTIHVAMGWGASQFEWNLQTDPQTEFLNEKGELETENNLLVGNTVTVTGVLSQEQDSPIIKAQFVRF